MTCLNAQDMLKLIHDALNGKPDPYGITKDKDPITLDRWNFNLWKSMLRTADGLERQEAHHIAKEQWRWAVKNGYQTTLGFKTAWAHHCEKYGLDDMGEILTMSPAHKHQFDKLKPGPSNDPHPVQQDDDAVIHVERVLARSKAG